MKRKGFYLLAMTIFMGFLVASPAMALPTAYLNLLDTPTAVGDLFEVEVWADGDDLGYDLLTFGFDVGFDSGGIFTYTGYTLNPLFDDFSDLTNPNNVTGDAFPGISSPPDDVWLATLSFTTDALGSDTLNVIGLYDGMFSGLYYETIEWDLYGYDIDTSLEISVEGTTPVPEPATILLVVSSLLAWAGLRKKTL